ncbi:MAG: YbaN family protein [Lachnospiraceae bacterium]|nr:YbaN family protein [Lachnospiraceae bacterium]
MVRIIFIIIGIVLMIVGAIGLALPVIPQIPFLAGGVVFLMMGSKRFSDWIKGTGLYKDHLEKHILKSAFLTKLLYRNEDTIDVSDS